MGVRARLVTNPVESGEIVMLRKTASVVAGVLAITVGTAAIGRAGECAKAKVTRVAYHKAEPKAKAEKPKDIVDTAVAAGSFKILAKALAEADLVEALKEEGPFTVFAPTDEAFEKLPEGTLEALLKDKDKLTAILKYHVVAGKVTAKDVVKLEEAETLLKDAKVKIDAKDGVKINGAKVVKADIDCTNGVIHVIDTVLIPE
jgi:uncharacterized surface protein with fasciclin (FAS1) repeats